MAERKVRSLLQAGAQVTVVAPAASAALRKLAAAGKISWLARPYRAGDVKEASLVFSATGNEEVERRVAAEAARRGIPVNCAGWPEFGSFLVPAQVRRGELQIAISSGGASPALARKVARQIQARLGTEYAEWTRVLARLRPRIQARVSARRRPKLFRELASDRFLKLMRKSEKQWAMKLAEEVFLGYCNEEKKSPHSAARSAGEERKKARTRQRRP